MFCIYIFSYCTHKQEFEYMSFSITILCYRLMSFLNLCRTNLNYYIVIIRIRFFFFNPF